MNFDLKLTQRHKSSSQVPHFTTLMNYLEKEELTSVLQEMIKLSALPMKGIETEYAIDSTGFSSTNLVDGLITNIMKKLFAETGLKHT